MRGKSGIITPPTGARPGESSESRGYCRAAIRLSGCNRVSAKPNAVLVPTRPHPKPPKGGFGILTESMSHICHIDESGDFGPLPPANLNAQPVQPVLVVVGLIVAESELTRMSREFIALRKTSEFLRARRSALRQDEFPREDRGKDMFRWALKSNRAGWQNSALSTLGQALALLERAQARVAGCVHLKGDDFEGAKTYETSVLSIAANFRRFLEAGQAQNGEQRPRRGVRVVCDNQEEAGKKVRREFVRRNLDPPEFVDSKNHIGVQLADWLCSAIIAPLAATRLSPESKHADTRYLALAGGENSVWERLMRMQFPFADDNGLRQPGIIVRPEKMRAKLFPEPVLGDPPA